MVEFNARVKRWGNSLGIIVPKQELQEKKIKEEETVHVLLFKRNPGIKKSFGALKGWKSGQEIKDSVRKELYD